MSLDKSKAGKFVKSIKQENVFMRFDTVFATNKYAIPDQLVRNLISDINEYNSKNVDTMYFVFDKSVTHFEEFDDQVFMEIVSNMELNKTIFLLFEDQCCHAVNNEQKIYCNSFDGLYKLIEDIKKDINHEH